MALLIDAIRSETDLDIDYALRVERISFGAKVRAARAILGLSQEEFAHQVGLTQRSIHRIEQGVVEPKLRTIHAIEQFWKQHGISIENLRDGGFRLAVSSSTLLGN